MYKKNRNKYKYSNLTLLKEKVKKENISDFNNYKKNHTINKYSFFENKDKILVHSKETGLNWIYSLPKEEISEKEILVEKN